MSVMLWSHFTHLIEKNELKPDVKFFAKVGFKFYDFLNLWNQTSQLGCEKRFT